MDMISVIPSISSMSSPWMILVSVLIGFIGFLLKWIHCLKTKNSRILGMIKDQTVLASEDSDTISTEYPIPYFSDSDSEDKMECSKSTGSCSSGYDTEIDQDMEEMLNIVKNAPDGPLCMEQTYLTFKCINTGLYVKAITDDIHSLVHMVTWNGSSWAPTICRTCIDFIRRTLKDGNCQVPFAMNLQASEEEMENVEEVRRQLKEYEEKYGLMDDEEEMEEQENSTFVNIEEETEQSGSIEEEKVETEEVVTNKLEEDFGVMEAEEEIEALDIVIIAEREEEIKESESVTKDEEIETVKKMEQIATQTTEETAPEIEKVEEIVTEEAKETPTDSNEDSMEWEYDVGMENPTVIIPPLEYFYSAQDGYEYDDSVMEEAEKRYPGY